MTRAFRILFKGISKLTHLLPHLQERYGDSFKAAAPFFEGLDAALAGIGMSIQQLSEYRAIESRDSSLVMQQAFTQAGDLVRAEFLMRR